MKAQERKGKIVAVSGGFDPVHIGHTRLFNEAKALGEYLVVILNNDAWLQAKKGYVFMRQEERKEILESLRAVNEVLLTGHGEAPKDMSVCSELRLLRPNIFANGGDRKKGTTPEYALCEELGIKMVFDVGTGGKVQSSSWLAEKLKQPTTSETDSGKK